MAKVESLKTHNMAPFFHSGRGIKEWYRLIIAALIPSSLLMIFLNPYSFFVFLLSFLGFFAGNKIIKLIFSKEIEINEYDIKYILWALLFTHIIGSVALPFVFLACAVGSAASLVLSDSEKTAFPSFALALLLVYSFLGNQTPVLGLSKSFVFLGPILIGVIFLLINRIIPFHIVAGIAIGSALAYILIPLPRLSLSAFSVLILSCPGFAPQGGIISFAFGLVAGALIAFLGPAGILTYFILKETV
ncbi:MAG: hypothetical protein ACQESB_03695 [Elusimicrobiota bacterium]